MTENRWKHRKRGTTYTEIARGKASVSLSPIDDYTPVVIYRGDDGQWWVRSEMEFDDGRFELLPEQTARLQRFRDRMRKRRDLCASIKSQDGELIHGLFLELADILIDQRGVPQPRSAGGASPRPDGERAEGEGDFS